ncbi:PKD domain-containing protein [Candidatus Acetothermia bacterium]|nr:PKD domain-containing protein [Candidatus Acetothermia bacterium]MBI3642725.1 PKD domain-containing protein [Candidatus Acetothermia bacterium]
MNVNTTDIHQKAKLLVILISFVFVLGLVTDTAQPTMAQTTQQSSKSNVSPKIDSVLAQVLQMAQQGGGVSSQSVQQTASRAGIQVSGNSVKVILQTSSPASGLITAVSAVSGGTITNQSRSFIELQIPLSNNPLNILIQLASIAGVAYIRPPLAPQALTVSEGVNITGAASFQNSGFRGQGIKVAVIDLGFIGLSSAQAAGEIPSNAITFDFSGTGLQSTTSHGTAVTEIVHDMAPDAQIYLMKVADEVDLENAVDQAISQGVQIVNHSVGWFNTNYYDGTGPIDASVQRARAAGILWVSAAGNYAQRHWKGVALDGNGNGWVEFSGQDGINFSAQAGQAISVYLTWRDWPVTSQDYDLFVTTTSGAILASSERLQSGTQPPTENIFFTAPSGGTFQIRVKPLTVNAPKELSIFNLNQDITPSIPSGSIVTPGDSSSAITVGAVSQLSWTTGPLEAYSSQGPTTDGRVKPDIVGPDNVSVSTAQFNPFQGTSAASPHVAGAAALLLSQNPALGASGVETKLRSDAVPMGASTQFGSGRLNLVGVITSRPDLTISNPTYLPSNPQIGSNVTITAQVSNQGNASAGSFSVQLSDSSGSLVQSFSTLAAGASTTVSFTRQLVANSQTETLTVDAFNQVSESNENNNSVQLTITSQTQSLPDLLVTGISFSPQNPQIGSTVNYTVTVANQGTGAASFFSVELRDSQGLSRLNLNGLAAGTSVQLAFQRQLTTSQETLTAVVDPFNQVTESNESNNSSQITVRAGSQLAIDVNTDRTSYNVGDTIQITFTLTGSGYVQLFDVNPNGLVSNLYPLGGGNGFLSPGTYNLSTLIGSSLQVTGPLGVDDIHAVVTSSQISFGLNGTQNSSYTNPTTFQAVLTQRIQATIPGASFALDFAAFQVTSSGPANQPPVSQFTFTPTNPVVNQSVSFDGSSSFDPDGTITDYFWVFQGSSQLQLHGAHQTVQFTTSRTYTITLTVTDNQGATGSSTQTLFVQAAANQPPVARIVLSTTTPQVGQPVTFNGQTSSDPDGSITSYRWDIDGNGTIDSTSSLFQSSYASAGTYTVTLTVFDNLGSSNSTSTTVTVSQTPPPPPPGPGVFIEGSTSSQIRITVQGDPSWNTNHTFSIKLRGTDITGANPFVFTSLKAEVTGNATATTTTFSSQTPTMTGSVKDGRILYTVGVSKPTAVWFTIELDVDGDGTREVGPSNVPIYVLIDTTKIQVKPRDVLTEFSLLANDGTLLPFVRSNLFVCNQVATHCVAL